MAALIAQYDWASTALGPLRDWPSPLKIATAIMLHSQLPMVMLVGRDGISLYNDGYANLIGNKHPATLGAPALGSWPRMTELCQKALDAGEACGTLAFRDLELTIYRTGAAEQVWMNIDCSPVLDEDGRPLGMLCVIIETTERVLAERRSAMEFARLRDMFAQAPGFICLMTGPNLIVQFVNEAHERLFGVHDVVGRPYHEAFAAYAGADNRWKVLDQVYATGERFVTRGERVLATRPGGRVEEIFLDLVVEPVTDDNGKVIGLFVEGFDVTPQVRAQAAAEENERRLSAAIAVARLGAFEWDMATGKATLDERALEIFALESNDGLTVADVVQRIDPEDMARLQVETRAAEASGRVRREFEYRIHLPDGATRNIATVSDAVPGPDGSIERIIGVFDDVTERRRAEKRQRLLINELNHRVKNTLATVQSIAAQTLRSAPNLERARDAFEARLVALAAAHDLLTAESWHGARLTDVVASAMAPFETQRRPQISRSGPPVWLNAQRALALSMALHELATNAVKYGALSVPEGRVTIRWTLSADNVLALSWIEHGGPPVAPPERAGFGSRLLQRSLARELGGEVAFTFAPDGVRCEVRCRLENGRSSAAPAMLEA
ncbi:PAS domain-containing protein [Phenylobacterium sp. LjRoot219]|uniref:sensor histidine kinase n=1 Tax=Phenylobacterium sp. LjRoot219 TaxID=3342283 RepID=UPI003ECE30E1